MIKFDAKVLHSFKINDFSGGINTDAEASLKELLQCKNLLIDSKGRPTTRGGSHVVNPTAPIGYQDVSVWGYVFGFSADPPVFDPEFALGKAVVASSEEAAHLGAAVTDGDPATYWLMKTDKFAAGTATVSSGANADHVNDGDDSTYWEAVI